MKECKDPACNLPATVHLMNTNSFNEYFGGGLKLLFRNVSLKLKFDSR